MPAAVVLAGGEGTRLAPLGLGVPKPMAPVADEPFLSHQLRWLRRCGISRIVLVVRRHDHLVRRHLGSGRSLGVRIRYAVADPRGNAVSLRRALALVGAHCFVVNGDTFFTFNPRSLIGRRPEAGVSLALVRVPNTARYGSVRLDPARRVSAFVEKGHRGPGLVYAGVLFANRSTFASVLSRRGCTSLEHHAFPALARLGKLYGVPVRGRFYDIGTPAAYRRFIRLFRRNTP